MVIWKVSISFPKQNKTQVKPFGPPSVLLSQLPSGDETFSRSQKGLFTVMFLKPPESLPKIKWEDYSIEHHGNCECYSLQGITYLQDFQKVCLCFCFWNLQNRFLHKKKKKRVSIGPLVSCECNSLRVIKSVWVTMCIDGLSWGLNPLCRHQIILEIPPSPSVCVGGLSRRGWRAALKA